MKIVTREMIKLELQRVAKLFNKNTLTVTEYEMYSEISKVTVIKYFKKWKYALEFAGLEEEQSKNKKIDREAMIEDLALIQHKMNKYRRITKDEYIAHGGKYNPQTIGNVLGWKNANELARKYFLENIKKLGKL